MGIVWCMDSKKKKSRVESKTPSLLFYSATKHHAIPYQSSIMRKSNTLTHNTWQYRVTKHQGHTTPKYEIYYMDQHLLTHPIALLEWITILLLRLHCFDLRSDPISFPCILFS